VNVKLDSKKKVHNKQFFRNEHQQKKLTNADTDPVAWLEQHPDFFLFLLYVELKKKDFRFEFHLQLTHYILHLAPLVFLTLGHVVVRIHGNLV